MSTTKERDLWRLGLAMSACLRGPGGPRARPKPAALNGVKDVLETLGVRVAVSTLGDEQARASTRVAIESAAARLYGAGAAPIASLGWLAGDLLRWAGVRRGSCDPALEPDRATAEAAQRFLHASESLAEPARSELEEVRGWCEAIVGGWVVNLRAKELCELIDEAFRDAPQAEPVDPDADEPATLETATREHVIEMIVMHHIVCSVFALGGDPSSQFHGTVREGEHTFNDSSESHFIVGWNEHGVAGFAFHKYACHEEIDTPPEERVPMRHLPGLPEELRPLATQLSNRAQRWWTAGFYLTKRARSIEPGFDDDGSEHFKVLVGPAREALFQPPAQWMVLRSITSDQAELARTLAKRAMAGGGVLTPEEAAIALGLDVETLPSWTEEGAERVLAELAKLGLTLQPTS